MRVPSGSNKINNPFNKCKKGAWHDGPMAKSSLHKRQDQIWVPVPIPAAFYPIQLPAMAQEDGPQP